MLRLDPTTIRLESRDLVWHHERHEKRQAARRQTVDYPVSQATGNVHSSQSVKATRTNSCVNETYSEDDYWDDEQAVSDQPVPRASREFWDKILEDAGTPTRTQEVSSSSGRIIEPSEKWIEQTSSSAASLASSSEDGLVTPESIQEPSLTRSSTVIKRKDLKKYYGIHEPPMASPPNTRHNTLTRASLQTNQQLLSGGQRHDSIRRSRRIHADGAEDGSREGSNASQTYQAESFIREYLDSALPDTSSQHGSVQDTDRIDGTGSGRHSTTDMNEGLSSNAIARNHQSLDARTPRNARPGLSLGSGRPQSQQSNAAGLLSQPPRRRGNRVYRLDGDSSPSAEPLVSPLFQFDGPGASPASIKHRSSTSHGLPGVTGTPDSSLDMSRMPPEHYSSTLPFRLLPQYLSAASMGPAGDLSSERTGESEVLHINDIRTSSYMSLNSNSSQSLLSFPAASPDDITRLLSPETHQETRQPSLPLPPPFSSTRRHVFVSSMAPETAASPTSASSPPPHHVSPSGSSDPLSLPHNPHNNRFHGSNPFSSAHNDPFPTCSPPQQTSITSDHPESPMTIYNDSLPPSHQPQTPADLSRHRSRRPAHPRATAPMSAPPRMATRDISWTQPAAFALRGNNDTPPTRTGHIHRNAATRGMWRRDEISAGGVASQVSGQARARRNELVENRGRVTEEERQWRRRRARGVGIGAEERERLQGGFGM